MPPFLSRSKKERIPQWWGSNPGPAVVSTAAAVASEMEQPALVFGTDPDLNSG